MAFFHNGFAGMRSAGSVLFLILSLTAVVSSQNSASADLRDFLRDRLVSQICPINDNVVARRVFSEYGAVFASSESVVFPPKCIFADDREVEAFQSTLKIKSAVIRGVNITLQAAAMEALLTADAEAAARNLRITPLDGTVAGRRSFSDTARIWNSRFFPALIHWTRNGRISEADATAARDLSILPQVEKVMEFESRGMFFSTGFSKSIFSSVAPPGTSQHLSLLAFDVVESHDPAVRAILNRHGWYQTVANDRPHFTFLGVEENKLPQRGLKAVIVNGHTFWVPNLKPQSPPSLTPAN